MSQLVHPIQSGICSTRCGTLGHTDLPSTPIDLWVVFHEPCMAEDDGCSSDSCDMEGGLFQVTSILDHEINDFSDVASFIKGSIHIIDRNGSGEVLGA